MNTSGARIVDVTICFCGRLAELIIGSAHLPQALRRTPATWCGPPGCAKGPGIHHRQPEAGGPTHMTNRSERGSRVDLFLVADLVLVDALLLMRAAGRRRAGGGQAGGRARARSAQQRAASSSARRAAAAATAAQAATAAARGEQQLGGRAARQVLV